MSKAFRPDGDGLEITAPSALVWTSAAASHAGRVRRYNEDAYFANPQQGIWCVADGMGGHAAGDLAARMLVEALALLEAGPNLAASVELLRTAIEKVNVALCGDYILAQTGGTCGSTVVALAIAGAECACLWAGDSRLYLYRAGSLYQMSRDHSLVQELLDQRLIESHEAGQHPRRHVITRAVGPILCWSWIRSCFRSSRTTCCCCAATDCIASWMLIRSWGCWRSHSVASTR